MAAAPADTPRTKVADRNLTHLAIIIIFGIFATTLPQPQVLGRLPLQLLLKNDLHVGREEIARFFLLCGLAWYLKPFAGILTDAFPLFRTRRRHYMLFSSVLAAASWIAIIFVPKTYSSLLWMCIIINLFMVMASTATGAFLVEAGQSLGATGRLTALRQFVQNFCTLANGPIAGWLATAAAGGALLKTGAINAGLVLSLFPVVYIFLRERPIQSSSSATVFRNAGEQLQTIGRSKTLWFALVFVGLFYFSPGFNTPLLFRQTDELKLTPQFIGNLGVFSGGAGLVAALLYGQLIKRVNIKTMILVGVVTAASGTFFYLLYNGPGAAIAIESQNGFFFTMAEVALLDLAARATPVGCEGLGYSLILSVRNLALFGADYVGSKLSDSYHWPFSNLVFLNAGTTAIVLILLPFMPAAIMRSRDRQGMKELEQEQGTPEAERREHGDSI
jgi:hypothetical protein